WVQMDSGGPVTQPAVPEIPLKWTSKSGRGYAVREPDSDTIVVRGSIGRRGTRYEVGAAEPALLAPAAGRPAPRDEGVEARGPARKGVTPEDAKLVHRHWSITLGEMVPQLNRHSDNFFAEHFWNAAVAKAAGHSSYENGGQAS